MIFLVYSADRRGSLIKYYIFALRHCKKKHVQMMVRKVHGRRDKKGFTGVNIK